MPTRLMRQPCRVQQRGQLVPVPVHVLQRVHVHVPVPAAVRARLPVPPVLLGLHVLPLWLPLALPHAGHPEGQVRGMHRARILRGVPCLRVPWRRVGGDSTHS